MRTSFRITRLGGWWRLWIVGSALWACGAVLVAINDFPTNRTVEAWYEIRIERVGGGKAWRAKKDFVIAHVPLFTGRAGLERRIRRQANHELRNELPQVFEAVIQSTTAANDINAVRELEGQLANLRPNSAEGASADVVNVTIGTTPRDRLVQWLVRTTFAVLSIPLFLLLLGLMIGWVREGFRRTKK